MFKSSVLKLWLIKLSVFLSVLIFTGSIFFLGYQFIKINRLESEASSLNYKLNQLEEKRQQYENEENFINSNFNEYIEDYIRRVEGMGLSEEFKFVID